MRLFPVLTAIAVVAVLYLLIFERDSVLDFSGAETVADASLEENIPATPADAADETNAVAVVAMRSEAKS